MSSAKILVLFYTTYGHNFTMAKAAAKGAAASGATVVLKRVAETLSDDILTKMHALEAQKQWVDVPIATVEELPSYDGIIFSFPTRFGGIPAQMKAFLDATGGLWYGGALNGKAATVMTSSATQHGGQETTIVSTHVVLLHHGFIIVGMPNSFAKMGNVDEVQGISPYGASTIAGPMGQRQPSFTELEAAEVQGKALATVAAKLAVKQQ